MCMCVVKVRTRTNINSSMRLHVYIAAFISKQLWILRVCIPWSTDGDNWAPLIGQQQGQLLVIDNHSIDAPKVAIFVGNH